MPLDQTILGELAPHPDATLKAMIDAGVFYGRKKTRTHPRMKPFIFGNRNGIEIIDLNKTLIGLGKATSFLHETVKEGKDLVLMVGTQPAAAARLGEAAEKFEVPYVTKRWVGGTLTNFPVVAKRIEHLKKLKRDQETGAFQKYTKKERLEFQREINRLEALFGSLARLTRLPDALLVVDSALHATAVREARRIGIPVVAFDNTDANPDLVDYLVIGNNAARASIDWFLGKMEETFAAAKQAQAPQAVPGEEALGSRAEENVTRHARGSTE